ncbi:hypothetical protein Golob_022650, partial [Gossypium lobatum]|nr:hypothetical protein [Gossypium lobatum]
LFCLQEVNQRARCRELAKSSSFYSTVYSEIEEVGWDHLVRAGGDLNFLIFRVFFVLLLYFMLSSLFLVAYPVILLVYFGARDKKGRVHVMEIQLDKTYPKVPPMVSADVPYIFNLKWSMNSRLKNLVQQFEKHLEKLQGFWSTLDEIDRSLQIVDSKQASRAIPSRQIHVGESLLHSVFFYEMIASSYCSSISMILDHYQSKKSYKIILKAASKLVLFSMNNEYLSVCRCRFMGLGNTVNSLRKTWKRNVNKWERDKAFLENLECLLNTQLPRLADEETNNHLDECGICYAQYLPIGDELGPQTGSAADYTCENNSCSKAFHSMCLVDWLRSITTTRQYVELLVSFNVLFGNCPYCSEPIAVKINATKN